MIRTSRRARTPRTAATAVAAVVVVLSGFLAVAGPEEAVGPASAESLRVSASPAAAAVRAARITAQSSAAKAEAAARAKAAAKAKRVAAAAAWLDGVRRCIAHRESRNIADLRPNWATASGLYQFTKRTWNNYKGYSEAYLAPASVQTERFYKSWAYWKKKYHSNWSRNPWNNPGGRQCW